jgi:hypothetical protein
MRNEAMPNQVKGSYREGAIHFGEAIVAEVEVTIHQLQASEAARDGGQGRVACYVDLALHARQRLCSCQNRRFSNILP